MKPVPELAAEIRQLNREIQALGTDLDNPLWTLVFLTFASILQLRLTYEGVYDVRRRKIVFKSAYKSDSWGVDHTVNRVSR